MPMAGAIPIIGVSPAPAEGRSLRSIRTLSITGISADLRHPVAGEAVGRDLVIGEIHVLKQRPADPHSDRALHLIAQMLGIHNGAEFELPPLEPPLRSRYSLEFRHRSIRRTLLEPRRNAVPAARRLLAILPAEFLRGGLDYGPQALVARAFLRRNSSGSMPAECASSSM